MVKGIDLIGKDKNLQNSWIKRIIAYIIDAIIITVAMVIVILLLTAIGTVIIVGSAMSGDVSSILGGVFLGTAIIILGAVFSLLIGVIYWVYFEGKKGTTPGKHFLKLRVAGSTRKMDYGKAFIRNLSKIFGGALTMIIFSGLGTIGAILSIINIFLVLDIIVGFVTEGDPRQRFLDRIAGTTVVRTDIQETFAPAPVPSQTYPPTIPAPSQAYPPAVPKQIETPSVTPAPASVSLSREEAVTVFSKIPGITIKKALSLYNAGFKSFSDLRSASPDKLLSIKGITLTDMKNIKKEIEF
ncbi:MAG: RDD family protein [Thermoplasmatales archaeon]|nr:RDD family protein [Thermoplasmatales archaeon]